MRPPTAMLTVPPPRLPLPRLPLPLLVLPLLVLLVLLLPLALLLLALPRAVASAAAPGCCLLLLAS